MEDHICWINIPEQSATTSQPVKSSVTDVDLDQQFPVQDFPANSMSILKSSVVSSNGGGGGGGSEPSGRNLQSTTPHPSVPLHGSHSSSQQKWHGSSSKSHSVGSGCELVTRQQKQMTEEDVSSYWDSVRERFKKQPETYRNLQVFLQELEFKGLDAYQVMDEVSKILHGHPDLILGFEPFVFSGCKTDVYTNGSGYRIQAGEPSTSATRTRTESAPSFHSDTVFQCNHSTIDSRVPLYQTADSTATCVQACEPSTSTTRIRAPSALLIESDTVSQRNYSTIDSRVSLYQTANSTATGDQLAQKNVSQMVLFGTSSGVSALVPAATDSQTPTLNSNDLNHNCIHAPLISQGHTSAINHAHSSSTSQSLCMTNVDAENYIIKIKKRFEDQPEILAWFMEIINIHLEAEKSKQTKNSFTEVELYCEIEKLFKNHEDLLAEFRQFIPDICNFIPTSHQDPAWRSKQTDNLVVPRTQSSLGLESSSSINPKSASSLWHKNNKPEVGSGSNHSHSSSSTGQSSRIYEPMTPRIESHGSSLSSSAVLPIFLYCQSEKQILPLPSQIMPSSSADPPHELHSRTKKQIPSLSSQIMASSSASLPLKLHHQPKEQITSSYSQKTHSFSAGLPQKRHPQPKKRIPSSTSQIMASSSASLPPKLHHQPKEQKTSSSQKTHSFPAGLPQKRHPQPKKQIPSSSSQIMASSSASLPPKLHHQPKEQITSPSSQKTHSSSADLPHKPHPQPKKQIQYSASHILPSAQGINYDALSDYAFFDRVYKFLKSPEAYDSFLRCVELFRNGIISPDTFLNLASPFLEHEPNLLQWFKNYMSSKYVSCDQRDRDTTLEQGNTLEKQEEFSKGKKFSKCRRLGASYCAVPKDYVQPKCSGRTALCSEVLNDYWISLMSYNDDSLFVISKKTRYETYIYRCEDEMFELDLVIETNLALIRVLESLLGKLTRMSEKECSKIKLDDALGGSSPCLNRKAIWRLYGDKAPGVMEGLRLQPLICVPIVLKRLKSKDEEWRNAKKSFNKVWREQFEKYHLKSLDHQGMSFKQNDLKVIRPKSLLNEIQTIFNDRLNSPEQASKASETHPHMTFSYKDNSVLNDAKNLILYYVKHQSIDNEDELWMKYIFQEFIPELFHHSMQESIGDNRIDDTEISEDVNDVEMFSGSSKNEGIENALKDPITQENQVPIHTSNVDDTYNLFFGSSTWYLFLRLHLILCERLSKILEIATKLVQEESINKEKRTEYTAMALNLQPKCDYLVGLEVEDYYPAFLDLVKTVLDGNLDASSYEDRLRNMFGIHAYVAFSLYKVVSHAGRELQCLISDESSTKCVDLYAEEARRDVEEGLCSTAQRRFSREAAYLQKAKAALADENCFKILVYKRDKKITIELLDTKNVAEVVESQKSPQNYYKSVDRFIDFGNLCSKNLGLDIDKISRARSIYLIRNVRRWKSLNSRKNLFLQWKLTRSNMESNNRCTFNLNSQRVLFTIDGENRLHKKRALSRAKQSHRKISRKLFEKFKTWHEQWVSKNVDQLQMKAAHDWLMGRGPNTVSNFTQIMSISCLPAPPYRSFNRYIVKRLNT